MTRDNDPFLSADLNAEPPEQAQAPPGGDPLLDALVWLTRHHGMPRSAETLRAAVPASSSRSTVRFTPALALRAAQAVGFDADVVTRGVSDISRLLLPAVLLMRNGDACIVLRAQMPSKSNRREGVLYEVLFPGPVPHTIRARAAELEVEYSGQALLISPRTTGGEVGSQGQLLGGPQGHWLWGTLWRFAPYYRSALLAALLSNVLMIAGGLVTSIIYDKVIPHQAFVTLWTLASGALLAQMFDLFARQLRSHLIDAAGRRADLIISARLFRQTLGVRMDHRPESAGSYAHYLAQVEVVRDFFASATMSALSDLPFIAIYVAMCFVTGGTLGWVLMLAIPLMLGMAAIIQAGLRRTMRENMGEQADLAGLMVEAVEGLEDLRTCGGEASFIKRYEMHTARAAETALKARNMASWSNNLSSSMQQLVTLVMLVWGVYLIRDGQVTAGALIGTVMFAGRAVAPLSSVVSLATRYQGAQAALQSLNHLMSKPTERDEQRAYVQIGQIHGRLGLNDVSFSYPTTNEHTAPMVLRNVSLKFEPGERVAIVGRIGSGKSTVLRLLGGLYQPANGMVEVDGLDLRQIDPNDFRARVGFVSQEPRLFKGSLRDNVLLGRNGIDSQRLTEVATLTGLDRVVAAHPHGWDLAVGEMGALLSGGQRQLVALARSLIGKPRILLMDEPTSSMDALSEALFLRQLKQAVGPCTLIMVTHRPSVLELVTRMIVMDNGRVVLDGPKDAVLAALAGTAPTSQTSAAPTSAGNVHLHPAARTVQAGEPTIGGPPTLPPGARP